MAHRLEKPKNISPIDTEKMRRWLSEMVGEKKRLIEIGEVDNIHVCISVDNTKTGDIPSVSLIPVHDCPNCKECSRLCYDLRNDCWKPNVRQSRARNSAILEHDPDRFFHEINQWIYEHQPDGFRWHVGGDAHNMYQFQCMVSSAFMAPETTFMMFTKADKIVNDWLAYKNPDHPCEVHVIPRNLKIIFSNWVGQPLDNPHNFPTSNPLFGEKTMELMGYTESTTAKVGDRICTGNCTECFCGTNVFGNENEQWHGCWELKKGEGVIFFAH